MRTRIHLPMILLITGLVTGLVTATLFAQGKQVALFDGKTLDGWVTGAGKPVTQGWVVEDGSIHRASKGGDIYTAKEYLNFSLEFEWKIAEKGNSGVKYRFTRYTGGNLGPEYQVLDDEKHPDASVGPKRQSASLYDILPPTSNKKLKPVGEWNKAKIVAKGTKFEHWLNGEKVIDVDINSDEYKAALAKSKFNKSLDFGTKPGKIMLQDHGDKVWYRGITIVELE